MVSMVEWQNLMIGYSHKCTGVYTMTFHEWRKVAITVSWDPAPMGVVRDRKREREREKRGRRTPTDRGTRTNQRNAGMLVRRIVPSILRWRCRMFHNGREVSIFCIPGLYRNFSLAVFFKDLVPIWLSVCAVDKIHSLAQGWERSVWMNVLIRCIFAWSSTCCAQFFLFLFLIVFVVHVLLRIFRTRTVWSQLEVFSSLSLSLSLGRSVRTLFYPVQLLGIEEWSVCGKKTWRFWSFTAQDSVLVSG